GENVGGCLEGDPLDGNKSAAWPAHERHCQKWGVWAGASVPLPRYARPAAEVSRGRKKPGARPGGMVLPAARLFGGSSASRGRRGRKNSRSGKAGRLHARPHIPYSRRRNFVWQRRRVDKVARCLHPIPKRHKQFSGSV